MEIIVKKYDHFNRTLNKHITSKKQYKEEMRKQGYVSWEEGERLAKKAREEAQKKYQISEKALGVIKSAKQMSRDGKIKCGDRLIEGMREVGVRFDKTPQIIVEKGGFDAS